MVATLFAFTFVSFNSSCPDLSDGTAAAVRIGTRLAGAELALLSRSGSASWTPDCKCLFEAEFFFHGEDRMLETRVTCMVNLGQFSESMRYTCGTRSPG
jgi:hypothetical protein